MEAEFWLHVAKQNEVGKPEFFTGFADFSVLVVAKVTTRWTVANSNQDFEIDQSCND